MIAAFKDSLLDVGADGLLWIPSFTLGGSGRSVADGLASRTLPELRPPGGGDPPAATAKHPARGRRSNGPRRCAVAQTHKIKIIIHCHYVIKSHNRVGPLSFVVFVIAGLASLAAGA